MATDYEANLGANLDDLLSSGAFSCKWLATIATGTCPITALEHFFLVDLASKSALSEPMERGRVSAGSDPWGFGP
jgi:hypothetical protein